MSSADEGSYIGTARMERDGTIILDLRAHAGGRGGMALLRYPPNHEQYREILDHIGGLKPGEEKLVQPWED